MGKVHRIKKAFREVVEQRPWENMSRGSVRRFQLVPGRGIVGLTSITVGRRSDDSWYIGHYDDAYKALVRKLIREYEAGVAPGD